MGKDNSYSYALNLAIPNVEKLILLNIKDQLIINIIIVGDLNISLSQID